MNKKMKVKIYQFAKRSRLIIIIPAEAHI